MSNYQLVGEYKLWQSKLNNLNNKPNNALDAMAICNKDTYPFTLTLLQILATIPMSNASNERIFSTLKRIKLYLGNTTSQASKSLLNTFHGDSYLLN